MACEVCGKTYVWNAGEDNFDSDAKPHVCTTCGQSFSLKIQLKRHTLLHANGEPYVCINCSKITEKKEPKSYNLRLSKKSDKYPCDICGESFSSKRMLLRHSTKEHTYENANSSYESDTDDYTQPKKRKSKKSTKRNAKKIDLYQCRTSSANELLDQDSDKSNKRFACPTCDKSFAYKSFLDRHVRDGKCKNTTAANLLNLSIKIKKSGITKSSGDKKHVCNICGKSFTRKSSLEGHELKHVKEKFGSAPEDNESFDDIALEDDSNDYELEPKKPRLSKIKIQKSYTCDQCNFVCFSKPTFDKHLNNHKQKSIEEEEAHDQGTSTESNEPEDSSEKVLDEKPSETEKEIHTCEICEKVFHTKSRLKRHLLFHVTGDDDQEPPVKWGWVKRKRSKDFSCEFCGKQFAGLTCLRKHSLKHTNAEGEERSAPKKKKVVQPMECQFCHEVFTGKRSAYIKHVHSHTPEVCGICDERFVDRQSLREHCRVHVGTEEGRMFMECSQKALDAKNGLLPPEPKIEYIYLVLR